MQEKENKVPIVFHEKVKKQRKSRNGDIVIAETEPAPINTWGFGYKLNEENYNASALDDISQAMYAAGFDKTAIALQTFSSILFGLNGVIKGVEAATIALNAALMAEGGIKNFLAGKIGIGDGR